MSGTGRPLLLFSVVLTALLAALLLSVLLREDHTLRNSLIDLSILPPIPRRAVLVEQGTRLAGDLKTRTLTPAENPYLLVGAVRIPPGVTVRAEPGTTLVAAEGAHLTVEGTLLADRTSLTSNHLHPDARLWHGIVVRDGGRAVLTDVSIGDASAALTCAAGGTIRLERGRLFANAAGIVSLAGANTCTIHDTWVREGRVGAQLIGGSARLSTITLDRVHEGMRVFHEATPAVANLTVRRPGHAVMVYQASPNLSIDNLTLPPSADPAALLLDGIDHPRHRWQGQEYETGRVRVR